MSRASQQHARWVMMIMIMLTMGMKTIMGNVNMKMAFHLGFVKTVGRTPFPSPQHPNVDYDYDSDDDEEEEEEDQCGENI